MMKVQTTTFTKVLFLFWECEIEHEYYYEEDANLNHKLCSTCHQCLLQQLHGLRGWVFPLHCSGYWCESTLGDYLIVRQSITGVYGEGLLLDELGDFLLYVYTLPNLWDLPLGTVPLLDM